MPFIPRLESLGFSGIIDKETLNTKFGQLADLRNSIRHSRSVDDVTRMEGKAAVLWFYGVLKIEETI